MTDGSHADDHPGGDAAHNHRLFGWRGAIPLKTILKPRLVPWRFFMLLSFMAWMVVMAHLVTLIKPDG